MPPVKIRLYVESPLGSGAEAPLTAAQAHYLAAVMRQKPGAHVRLFNGRDGEWLARIKTLSRGAAVLACEHRLRAQSAPPRLRLLLAPLKKSRFDFAVEKAAELGAGRITPVITENTAVKRINAQRLRAVAVEAAEQCERLHRPEVDEAVALENALADWPEGDVLFFCDETGQGAPMAEAARAHTPPETAAAAVLTGPEGGFSAAELAMLRRLPFAHAVGLGPRVLRAETAVCAALALYQAAAGDGNTPSRWLGREKKDA
ncbi:MAG: 16S rRNA (uracil(1498)-N(3))-methyltransferase [Rhodospirillales bacterium]